MVGSGTSRHTAPRGQCRAPSELESERELAGSDCMEVEMRRARWVGFVAILVPGLALATLRAAGQPTIGASTSTARSTPSAYGPEWTSNASSSCTPSTNSRSRFGGGSMRRSTFVQVESWRLLSATRPRMRHQGRTLCRPMGRQSWPGSSAPGSVRQTSSRPSRRPAPRLPLARRPTGARGGRWRRDRARSRAGTRRRVRKLGVGKGLAWPRGLPRASEKSIGV